jgi:Uma2 family endonuclease
MRCRSVLVALPGPAFQNETTMQPVLASCTRDDYLRLDETSDSRHEFFQGEVFAMTGGSFKHAAIGLNIAACLTTQLRGSPCRPMNRDMRIRSPSGLDTYPDVSVFCGDPELTDREKTLLNPVLIVEVLSPTTRSYDRGDKFALYRSIPSLRDYLLVDSEQVLVEHFRRLDNGEWLLHEYRLVTDGILLASIDTTPALSVIYEDIDLM